MKKRLPASGLLLLTPAISANAAPLDALGGGKIIETLVGLALVLLLIFALAHVLRKVQGQSQGGAEVMRIVSSMSLGAKERIMLLHVADRQILVAVTPQAISALHIFEEKVPVMEARGSAREPGQNFTAILQGLGTRNPK